MNVPILAIGFLWKFIAVLWLIIGLILILIVLIQKGKGAGLGGAFGGAGGANSILGTKTGDFLTWITIGLVAAFLLLAVVLGIWGAASQRNIDASTQPAPVPAAPAETETPAAEIDTEGSAGPIEEIAETVVEEMNLKDTYIEYTGGKKGWVGDVPYFHYDINKINSLGWKQRYSSLEAIRITIKKELRKC